MIAGGTLDALGIYAVAGVLFLLAAWVGRLDVDAGGYVDSFVSEHLRYGGGLWYTVHRLARDKVEHAVIALCLGLIATLASRAPWGAFWITVGLGAGWEIMQAFPRGGFRQAGGKIVRRGFASWRDLVADAVGAAIGCGTAAAFLAVMHVGPYR